MGHRDRPCPALSPAADGSASSPGRRPSRAQTAHRPRCRGRCCCRIDRGSLRRMGCVRPPACRRRHRCGVAATTRLQRGTVGHDAPAVRVVGSKRRDTLPGDVGCRLDREDAGQIALDSPRDRTSRRRPRSLRRTRSRSRRPCRCRCRWRFHRRDRRGSRRGRCSSGGVSELSLQSHRCSGPQSPLLVAH